MLKFFRCPKNWGWVWDDPRDERFRPKIWNMKLKCSLVLHLPPLPGFLYFVWLLTGNCSSPHFPPFPPTFVINCQLFVSSSPIMTLFKLPTPTFNSCWSELVEKLTNLIEFSIIDKISTSIHNIDFHNINFNNIIWDITQCKLWKSIQPMLFNTFFSRV